MVDYNLANQSGAQFRAELNLILAALQSCAYGGTAPATTTAGQLWVDAAGTGGLELVEPAAVLAEQRHKVVEAQAAHRERLLAVGDFAGVYHQIGKGHGFS